MRYLLCLILLSPFLVCDPYQGAGYFVVTGLPAAVDGSHVAPDSTGTFGFKLDLANLPAGGPYTVKVKACSDTWGCSDDSLPFVFTRPALSAPAGPKVVK